MPASERLATLDKFGVRHTVIPAEVKGPLRKWRTLVYWILLVIFLALPWIKINGLQAVWLDVPGRRFEIFGMLFLAHDAPLLFFIILSLALTLATVTALWGRIWCGWACPQTVFIDAVYRQIEIWIEGSYIERRKLRNSPWTASKFLRVSAKWAAYIIVSSIFAHSFIAYFSGAENLIAMIQRSPGDNWGYFVLVSSVTAILLVNFGWFREQVCLIVCPYGRFQSVLMDQNTVAVLYDQKRGEPRKGSPEALSGATKGDCVSCNRCVEVCPTGIDIRNGLQMECIACTACIDACNTIMKKVNKPEGLIRHQRVSATPPKGIRFRVALYVTIISLCMVALVTIISMRKPFSATILRATDIPYQVLGDGLVLNHFKAHLINQTREDMVIDITLSDELIAKGAQLTQADQEINLPVGASSWKHFFVRFPSSMVDAHGSLPLVIFAKSRDGKYSQTISINGVGPYSKGS